MRKTGEVFENLALKYLQRRGLTLLDRNVHCRYGELDLIMRSHDTLVFVEVRYRKRSSHGSALESVDQRKQARIIQTAEYYISKKALWNYAVRFDVIAIEPKPSYFIKPYSITWLKAAFEA